MAVSENLRIALHACASAASRLSCSKSSPPKISDESSSCGARVAGFTGFVAVNGVTADVDDRQGGVRGYCDGIGSFAEHCADQAHVLLRHAPDRRCVLQDLDILQGGDCKDGSRERERDVVDAPVIHDGTQAGAETAQWVEDLCSRTDDACNEVIGKRSRYK